MFENPIVLPFSYVEGVACARVDQPVHVPTQMFVHLGWKLVHVSAYPALDLKNLPLSIRLHECPRGPKGERRQGNKGTAIQMWMMLTLHRRQSSVGAEAR